MREGEITLRVENGAKVATVAMGTYSLWLPSKISLVLRDCYFVPTMSRNLISISYLIQEDYVNSFFKDHCNIYFENKKISSGFLINNLFQLYVDVSVNHSEHDMNAIRNKHPSDELTKGTCGT